MSWGPGALVVLGQELGDFSGPHLGRIGPGAVEEGTTGPVDGSHRGPIEGNEVGLPRCRVVGVGLSQTSPSPSHPHHLVTFADDAVDHCLDAGVEAGHVAPTGQDSYPH